MSRRFKVANFSIDLPDATVAIQVSGAFGSRQERSAKTRSYLATQIRWTHSAFLFCSFARHY